MTRKTELDILRGLMIICVVIGHCSFAGSLYVDIFWFHMPVFFMISGYLTKVPTSNPLKDKELFRKKANRLVVPYLSYSFILYLIFRPEGILKNLVRTLYAGFNNITIYSYPFWFINALFVSSYILICILWKTGCNKKQNYVLMGIFSLIYIIIHLKVIYPLPFPLPWGLDQMLGGIIFMYIGYVFKNVKNYKTSGIILSIFAILFPIIIHLVNYDYTINMQQMKYNNFLLDLLVPCSFGMLFFLISSGIKHVPFVNKLLCETGQASMTIFFTHTSVFYFIGNEYPFTRIMTALVVGCILHRLFILNKYTRHLFIGTK